MSLVLLFSLACAVQAEQAPPPTPSELLEQAHKGNLEMQELEQRVAALAGPGSDQAVHAAQELTSNCPYNGATLQLMGTLIAQVPQDSATREGIDSMARMLGHLELDPGQASVEDTRARLEGIGMAVNGLSEAELAHIEASYDTLQTYTGGDSSWPPKQSFIDWREQLRAEGQVELAELLDLQISQRC